MLQRSSARYVIALYVSDIVLVVIALFGARWLRLALPWGKALDAAGAATPWPMFVLAILVWTIALVSFRAYDPPRLAHLVDEVQTVVAAISVATLVFSGVLYLSYRGLSRLLFVYFFCLNVLLCLAGRALLRRLKGLWDSGRRRSVLIVGAGGVGRHVAVALGDCAWLGLELIGYVDDDPTKAGRAFEGYPVLGATGDTAEIVTRHGVQELILALPMAAHPRLADLVASLEGLSVNIKVVPDYSDLTFYRTTLERYGDLLFIGLKEPVLGPIDRVIKRAFDVIVGTLCLVILSPLLGALALLVKLSSPGPVLYHSQRVGEGGTTFHMLKYRTMTVGADREEGALVSETVDGKVIFDKREDDPRITSIGRVLRRYSLDELPQLVNVLRGEMSLVGPRPELPALVARYEPWQRKRFGVPQGITGWWQISGRSSKAKYLHVEDDLYYIRNYSLLLDLRVLWRTLGTVIKGEGAF